MKLIRSNRPPVGLIVITFLCCVVLVFVPNMDILPARQGILANYRLKGHTLDTTSPPNYFMDLPIDRFKPGKNVHQNEFTRLALNYISHASPIRLQQVKKLGRPGWTDSPGVSDKAPLDTASTENLAEKNIEDTPEQNNTDTAPRSSN